MKNSFSWENFDINFIRSVVYSEKTSTKNKPKDNDIDDIYLLLPYIDRIAEYPDKHFIRRYRTEITDHFIAGSVRLVNIIKALEKKNYHGVKTGSMEDMLLQFRGLRLTSSVLTLLAAELYRYGKKVIIDDDASIFCEPKTISLKECETDVIPLYDYQEEAVNRLIDSFINKGDGSGVLVMPTGSGKTRVAVRFLLQEMVGRGYQVIWLTHRALLIEQTADSVYKAAPIIKYENSQKEHFKMVCVSGLHSTKNSLEKDDDVIIFSVQSLYGNLPYLDAILAEKVLVIVDEAHHTLAPSYRLIIDHIRRLRPGSKLLGLTATPVRMTDEDTSRLMRIFDNRIIYSIAMSTLIAKGILATPVYFQVDTNVDFDTTITLDDKKYIKRWGELSPQLLERIANTAERNELIVNTYMSRKEEFGKTLIFALNATHCISLCEAFQDRGVRCDYIYCAHPGNEEKISRFKNGELDVLVNINVMTEGSDVPDIKTVFLTRPTTSDVLLMQMIGRGMRGVGCGGTETVNIVDFHDIWGSFTEWLNPQFLLYEENEQLIDRAVRSEAKKPDMVPWAMIRDLFDGVSTRMSSMGFPGMVLPSGWYDTIDEDGNDRKVLVFESQLDGYKAMWGAKKEWKGNKSFDGETALAKYFGGFGLTPTAYELQMLIDYYRKDDSMLHLYPITGRKTVDPAYVGKRLKEANANSVEVDEEVNRLYEDNENMINSIYSSLEIYKERVWDYIRYDNGLRLIGTKIEEIPCEFLTLDQTPVYDLEEMTKEVIAEMFDGVYANLPPVRWTSHPCSSYFGLYTYPLDETEGKDHIKINCILNSKDVPREAVKFVIYHELLHKGQHKHNKEFRSLEHKYPNFIEYENFLLYTFNRFNMEFD